MLDRAIFFAAVRRAPFNGTLTQKQVDGLNFIVGEWERTYRRRTSIPQFADVLATTFHESAQTMQPIKEIGNRAYFIRMYDKTGARPKIAAQLGNTEVGDGAKYPGMGYVQSTGRANARRATERLRELKIIGPDLDFERTPELLMKPEYAIHILFLGMEEGWFTGKTLDGDIDDAIDGDEFADFIRARRIVNGTDRAEKIAGYGMAFLNALIASLRSAAPDPSPVVSSPPIAPAEPLPLPVPPPPPTLMQRIKSLLGI